ncbi:hypothetical protein ACVW18_003135 [Bacillus thuringiensis]
MKIYLITLKSHGVLEAQFRADVQRAYNNSSVDVSVPEKPSKPAEVPTAVTDGIAYIEGYNVNLRKDQVQAILSFAS